MIRVFRDDTQWALAGKVPTAVLEQIARQLPKELQDEGSKVVAGNEGFAALLVFGDLPSQRLAHQLLAAATPVYLLDFDDDAPATLKLDRNQAHVTEDRIDEHPADFLKLYGIVAPGYSFTPPSVRDLGLVEGISLAEAKQATPPEFEVELREHPRGVLVLSGPVVGLLARKLKRRAYCVYWDPKDKWFSCVAYAQGGIEQGAYSSGEPIGSDTDTPRLDNILGETTLEGILRVLEIPGELLGI